MQPEGQTRRYVAFISYRHVSPDRGIARRIHTKIEHFRIPEEYREAYGSDRLGLAFRDEEELPASSNLSDNIREALDNSDFLVVVCTPKTPESAWVGREITYFMEHHERDHVLAVLAAGTPETSFPRPLLEQLNEAGETEEVEPLAANLTEGGTHLAGGRFSREITRIFAAILGCPFDGLWQRERRYRTRRIATILGAGLAAALVFLGVVLAQNRRIREQSEQIEADSAAISEQNREISEKNGQILTQVEELKERENIILTNQGELLLDKGDRKGAAESALEALDGEEEERPYYPQAEKLLLGTLGAYQNGYYFAPFSIISLKDDVVTSVLSRDGSLLAAMDRDAVVSLYETAGAKLLWQYNASYIMQESLDARGSIRELDTHGRNLLIDEINHAVIVTLPGEIHSLSVDTGEERWAVTDVKSYVRSVSPDGTRMTVMGFGENNGPELRLIDLSDGSLVKKIKVPPLSEDFKEKYYVATGYAQENPENGVFSPDGKSFAFAVACALKTEDGEIPDDASYESSVPSVLLYYRWDINTSGLKLYGYEGIQGVTSNKIYGMTLDNSGEFTIYRYDQVEHKVVSGHYTGRELQTKRGEGEQLVQRTSLENRSCFLPGKKFTLLSVNNILYVYDASTGVRQLSHNEGQDIEALCWRDQEQTFFDLVTEDGVRWEYVIGDEDNNYHFVYIPSRWPLVSMGEICELASTPALFPEGEYSGWLTEPLTDAAVAIVRRSRPREIIFFRPLADPHGEVTDYDEEAVEEARDAIREEQAGQAEAEDEKPGDPFLFKLGDRIRTEDGRYEILFIDRDGARLIVRDLVSGREIFDDPDRSCCDLFAWHDETNHRLYILYNTIYGNMLCLDTGSGEVLFDIEDAADYLPAENRLIMKRSTGDGTFFAYPAYTTGELISWGREWLHERK
ncbi:MAG: toll/interleukin-1 receptor domain-containing protein [Lachnospiraceae bacterium]|nr:toll/interleukin-1 receptor domain-containing protein [Lachnospiraceae bacterium]